MDWERPGMVPETLNYEEPAKVFQVRYELCLPPERHSLNLSIFECDLTWKEGHCRCNW